MNFFIITHFKLDKTQTVIRFYKKKLQRMQI